jgi:hypothetical protein
MSLERKKSDLHFLESHLQTHTLNFLETSF